MGTVLAQGWGRATPISQLRHLLRIVPTEGERSCICLWMSSCSLHLLLQLLITFRTDCGRKRGEKEKHSGSVCARTRNSLGKQNRRRGSVRRGTGDTVHDHLLSSQEPKDHDVSLTCPIHRPVLQFEQHPANALVPYWGPSLPVRVRAQSPATPEMGIHVDTPFYTHQLPHQICNT